MKLFLDNSNHTVSLIPIESLDPESISIENTVGLVVPVAFQGTFPIIWDFVEQLPKTNGTQVFLIDSLGSYSGGILGPMKKILVQKGYDPIGAIEIQMPNTFQSEFNNIEKREKLISNAKIKIKTFCNHLEKNRSTWRDIPLYSNLLSLISRNTKSLRKIISSIPITRNNACNKCGVCLKLCPMHCISMNNSNTLIIDSSKCILCQRCHEYCPSTAITIGKNISVKNGLIPLSEMLESLKTN